MNGSPPIDVVIPAFNEHQSIGRVLGDLPGSLLRRVVVVDNGSTDDTAAVARAAGATVVREPRRGYGSACLAGIAALQTEIPPPGVLVFLDADYSDHPEELPLLIRPILEGRADMVVGSRALGAREPGALLPQARFGNWLASRLLRVFYGLVVTDLGPFRAIRWSTLQELGMRDRNFGWTVEMQIKAARAGVRYREVPVSYRRRIGASKISGTLRGSLGAGTKILFTLLRYRLTPGPPPSRDD